MASPTNITGHQAIVAYHGTTCVATTTQIVVLNQVTNKETRINFPEIAQPAFYVGITFAVDKNNSVQPTKHLCSFVLFADDESLTYYFPAEFSFGLFFYPFF